MHRVLVALVAASMISVCVSAAPQKAATTDLEYVGLGMFDCATAYMQNIIEISRLVSKAAAKRDKCEAQSVGKTPIPDEIFQYPPMNNLLSEFHKMQQQIMH